MAEFTVHTIDTAPADAKPILEKAQKSNGFVPNLYGVFAEAPNVLAAYGEVGERFGQSTLTAVERNVVWLTNNFENNCHYCVPAHTAIAKSQKVPDDVIEALREGRPIPDAKLEALRQFTVAMIVNRGDVDAGAVQAFLDAGFTKANVLEVILGIAHKVLSNYANHLADTPVDAQFQPFAWTHPQQRVAAE